MISNTMLDRYTGEREFYNRMGWASCPKCEKICYNWEELKKHIDCCVYKEREQGINLVNRKFTWKIK